MPPPGGYGGPGTPPPFFPPPGGPPPRGSSRGLVIALLGGAGLVLVVVIALVLAFTVFQEDKMTASERLSATATSVSTARALTLKGTFSGGGDTLQGEMKVTRGGRAAGQVSWDGDNVTLLSADDKLFVKAPKSYWSTKVTSSSAMLKDGDQWGKVSSSDLSLDAGRALTPAALSRALRSASTLKYTLREATTTVQGRKALRIGTTSVTFYVTDSKTPELLRYESSYPRVQVDVTAHSAASATTTISEIRGMMGELKDSFDSEARVVLMEWANTRCTTNSSGCRVRGRFRPVATSGSAKVEVKFSLTSTAGRDLGDCTTSFNASSNANWAECRVASSAWASWSRSGQSRYRQNASFRVQGATQADVETLQSGLDRE
ncbi:hypothetical protein [Actinomadura rudentiformis]|nr:hypothetical protein [Actinomadura rudentiformis]